MFLNSTKVSRPPAERKILDLQDAESAIAWIMSFVAECCAEKKDDELNIDGALIDLQVTNLLHSMHVRDTNVIHRNLTSTKNSIDTPNPKEKITPGKRA